MSAATPAEAAEFERRASPDIKWKQGHDDPIWRLTNLYRCLDEGGNDVHFVPSEEQRLLIICIYIRGWRRIIIPKARQLGMSLDLALISLDSVLFNEGFNAALIDKTGDDAEKKMREKIKFAWERLPAAVKAAFVVKRNTNDQLILGLKKYPESPESTFSAVINYRGGTLQLAWISEWGWVQDNDRPRSREINAGVMPAIELAEDGLCVIETTWSGGLDGELGPYVHEAMNLPEEQKGPKSWRILFFGWTTGSAYRQSHGMIDPQSAAYFREVEKRVPLTMEQKYWYAEKRRTASSAKKVKEEYPTFVEECWENMPQGSIYGKWIEEARSEGRISNFIPPRDYPVHTFWDLGHSMNTVDILIQITPNQIRIVDCLMEVDMTVEQRAEWHRALGWQYGSHYLPWDADTDNASIGIKPVDHYRRAFGPTVRVVPQCRTKWDGIGIVRANFNRFVFCCDSLAKDTSTPGGRVKQLLEHLSRYRAERESSTGIAKDEPVHDRYSHAADALRQLGQAMWSGLVENANTVGGRPQAFQDSNRLRVVTAGSNW